VSAVQGFVTWNEQGSAMWLAADSAASHAAATAAAEETARHAARLRVCCCLRVW
jgi:hypothetical protein